MEKGQLLIGGRNRKISLCHFRRNPLRYIIPTLNKAKFGVYFPSGVKLQNPQQSQCIPKLNSPQSQVSRFPVEPKNPENPVSSGTRIVNILPTEMLPQQMGKFSVSFLQQKSPRFFSSQQRFPKFSLFPKQSARISHLQ